MPTLILFVASKYTMNSNNLNIVMKIKIFHWFFLLLRDVSPKDVSMVTDQ